MHTHAPIGAVAVGRVPESADFATDFATERRPTSADAAIIGVWVRPFSMLNVPRLSILIRLSLKYYTFTILYKSFPKQASTYSDCMLIALCENRPII